MGLSRIRAVPELAVLRCCAPANWAYTGPLILDLAAPISSGSAAGATQPRREIQADDHEALNIYPPSGIVMCVPPGTGIHADQRISMRVRNVLASA
jgi:hypothetical protein